MKIAVLLTAPSGFMNACLRELSNREGVELFVCHQAPLRDAPYDDAQFAWIKNRLVYRSDSDLDQLEQRLLAFDPRILILPSWHIPRYRRIARTFANRSWRVMTMDNPWIGSWRQWLGTLISPVYVKPLTDVVWLPGERQAVFARKLGFSQNTILRGLLTCDRPRFEAVHNERVQQGRPVTHSFLYVGRFSPEKGIVTLANAYRLYSERAPNPWPLICCGSGPLQSHLENIPGIQLRGFVQPGDVPSVMAQAGCLIMPSDWDHWGVAVHEAATAGLLILASETVGAVAHLVQPRFNGFVFGYRDVEGLSQQMAEVSAMSDAVLDEMSRASSALSRQYSPERWADTLLQSYGSVSGVPATNGRHVAVAQ